MSFRARTRYTGLWAVALLGLTMLPARAQTPSDAEQRIRQEGMENSQVMTTLHHLTDLHGPRLTGSPSLEAAGAWALEQMTAWGLENAHAEAWDWGHPGWENERLSAHIVAPVRDALVAEVLAWTPGTDGEVTASAYHLVPPDAPTAEELDAFLEAARAAIPGRMVLVGALSTPRMFDMPQRSDDAEMAARYDPHSEEAPRSYGRGGERSEGTLSSREVDARITAFLVEAGAAVQVNPSGMDAGLIRAFANRTYDPADAVPTVVLRNEDYGRITRLLADGHEVRLAFDIVNRIYPEGQTAYNYIAEIPGTDLANEVILLGGHLDSWHAATGATDNAAGVSIMMEAARILKTLGLQPRRTVRVALWTGEEQGLLGSKAYVERHFGTAEAPKAAHARVGGYFNVDSGTGRLRGATVFGPPAAAEVLEEALAGFEDLGFYGARPTDSRRRGGSDHTSFNWAGLPGISLGQDPIRYFTHTWHTNIDTYEHVLPEDVQQAAVIVAAAVYHLATRDALLPRFPADGMPSAPGTE